MAHVCRKCLKMNLGKNGRTGDQLCLDCQKKKLYAVRYQALGLDSLIWVVDYVWAVDDKHAIKIFNERGPEHRSQGDREASYASLVTPINKP